MSRKKLIMLGAIVGSTVGGYLPTLFGVGGFSLTALLCSTLGGIVGIYLGYRLAA